MLSDAIGCIGFSWAASPACTELESIVLDWYAKALDLPTTFLSDADDSIGGGVIQGSASECILVTMLAARCHTIRALKTCSALIEDSAFLPRLVAYCSTEAHSCVEKAAMISLVKLRILESDDKCRLRGCILEAAIVEDINCGLVPFYVSATLGTTGSCAFDSLLEIGPVCKRFPSTWLHVDGAYAGSCFICPEMRYLMAGIEHADSFNTNPNKWLLVSFDCSCLWVRDRVKLSSALVVDPLYLQHANSADSIDYRHWGIPLSRRFRALKLWFVMRSYGIIGLQSYIRNHIRLARRFEVGLCRDRRIELLAEVRVGLVCFRLREADDKLNQELLANINASGKLHMIPARVSGCYALRLCVVRECANEEDLDYALDVLRDNVGDLLMSRIEPGPDVISQSPNSPAPLDRRLVRKFSFTRSISRDAYKRSKSRTSLHDGATPIMVVEEQGTIVGTIREDIFCNGR